MENQEYKVKQIWPAHADHISHYKDAFLNDLFKNNNVVVQRKYDGERMLVHFNNGEVYCTSRRHSKKTNRFMENQDKSQIILIMQSKKQEMVNPYIGTNREKQ